MCRCRKSRRLPHLLSETDKEHPLPNLRNTVVNGVKQRVGGNKIEFVQLDRDLLGNVAPAGRQGNQARFRRPPLAAGVRAPMRSNVHADPRAGPSESFRVACDSTQLRPTNAGKGLAGRAAHYHVHRLRDRSEAQTREHISRRRLGVGQIPTHCVPRATSMKIQRVGSRRLRIGIDTREDLKSSALEPEGQAATPCENIEDPRCAPLLQSGKLTPDRFNFGRSEAGGLHRNGSFFCL